MSATSVRLVRFTTLACFGALLGLGLGNGLAPAAALQAPEPSWLDDPNPPGWNLAGMPLPTAPAPPFPIEARFRERNRPPETAEDAALVSAGWDLVAPYHAGWGVKLIMAASYYDGMGRPLGFQWFVFVDGTFAGTLSPGLMNARSDSALTQAQFFGPTTLTADFVRYAASDPLCCPSARSSVQFRIERSPQGPVVVPESAFTRPLAPERD